MGRRGRQTFDKSENVYFVTTTLTDFIKVLSVDSLFYDIVLESLKYQLAEHSAILLAYVIMPNHVHLVQFVPEGESISDFMRDFKRHTSTKIKEELERLRNTGLLNRLISTSGTGRYKLWMDRFDCQEIVTERVLTTKINYVNYNPVRAGLVSEMTDWKYSSARNYYLGDQSLIYVSTDWNIENHKNESSIEKPH